MKPSKNTPPSSEISSLRITLDLDRIPGERLAAIVDEVRGLVGDHVLLTELRSEPVVLELAGPRPDLERLRSAAVLDGLRWLPSSWRPTIGGVRRHTMSTARSARLVLLVDGDDGRARSDADVLGRSGIEACVVGSVGAAVLLLQRSALPFDAVVARHHLPEGNALQVLDRVRPEQRRCSVLVIDAKVRPEIARAYRVRGAFRYVPQPEGPLQLISRVHATILDTQAWRQVESPGSADGDEPPRQLVDPEHAALRLQFVCGLTPLEREVASMMLRGLRDLDIADLLDKSERTAKRYVGKVLEKAGIENRASLWGVLHQDALGELVPLGAPVETPAPSPEPTPRASTPSPSPSRPAVAASSLHASMPAA